MRAGAPGALGGRAHRLARGWVVIAATACGVGLSLTASAPAIGAAAPTAPLESGTATSAGSWVILPMGQLSDEKNTFWQLFHASAGSSHWSVATPPGAADNGGIVAGTSDGSILVGVLPNGMLRFSPLTLSSDGGTGWNALYLPGGLAAVPDALALGQGSSATAIAAMGSARVLTAAHGVSSWAPLVSTARLRQVSPRCGVTTLNAVAFQPTGAAVVAAGCARGGVVGVFTRNASSWRASGVVLRGSLAGSSTSVLRLETEASTTTALVSATRAGRRSLIAMWRSVGTAWRESALLALDAGRPVFATAVGLNGTLAVLLATKSGLVADDIEPGGSWTRLPAPPRGTVALAPVTPAATLDASALDAFTVSGTDLGVFALTRSGTSWARVQSIRVELGYGSS